MSVISYALAFAINAQVNSDIYYHADKSEKWQVGVTQGDCDDYVMTKRDLIRKHCTDCTSIMLATVNGVNHAVLEVNTDKGKYILDNRYSVPMRQSELPYDWKFKQIGKHWQYLKSIPPIGWRDWCKENKDSECS